MWGQFRNLPYQAIGARLADVKPAQGDWKPEDTVWFNGRVADKQFVSVVKAVEGTAEEPLVVLSLVDTSHPSEGRFISQELIQVHVDNSLVVTNITSNKLHFRIRKRIGEIIKSAENRY